jgi:isoprenylcysteine carboxyl methyltransferase (ICMT) family protein YpbQ
MSISLTIYVTLAHFIKTKVKHPNYICNIIKTNIDISFYNVTYIVRMIDISFYNVTYIVRMIDIWANATYHLIKTNVNHPNYICNIRPFYEN